MEQSIIPFQKPYRLESAWPLIEQVLVGGRTEGDGPLTTKCRAILAGYFAQRDHLTDTLMVTSGTHALELALQALRLQPGDEVIIPSFAYPSAANAVILAGGTVVYAEVEPVHLNLDPVRLPMHVTARTRAVILVHYGGISCDLDPIMTTARVHCLVVIEDCAQSFLSAYHGQLTGTIGQFGCFSFHGTKDVICGEGGALQVNDLAYQDRVHLFRQKGTNREAFARGLVSFYDWQSTGSSYAPGELAMALLLAQLEWAPEIVDRKQALFRRYVDYFNEQIRCARYEAHLLSTSTQPTTGSANGHLFFMIFKDASTATALVRHLAQVGIESRTHFVPLHESPFGQKFIRPANDFKFETGLGQRLVRLPLFAAMTKSEQNTVLAAVDAFFTEVC